MTSGERRRFNLRRAKHERRIKRLWSKVLRSYNAELIGRLKSVQTVSDMTAEVDRAIDQSRIASAVVQTYTSVGTEFARDTYKRLTSGKKARNRIDTDYWSEEFEKYARQYAATEITLISGTTEDIFKDTVNRIVLEAGEEGLGVMDTLRRIQSRLDTVSQYRAERIARTEIVSASNAAQFMAGKASGIECEKGWLHSGGINERPEHAALDGTYIGMDELFDVGGERMNAPGDGSAENVINCRCVLDVRPKPIDEDAEIRALFE